MSVPIARVDVGPPVKVVQRFVEPELANGRWAGRSYVLKHFPDTSRAVLEGPTRLPGGRVRRCSSS